MGMQRGQPSDVCGFSRGSFFWTGVGLYSMRRTNVTPRTRKQGRADTAATGEASRAALQPDQDQEQTFDFSKMSVMQRVLHGMLWTDTVASGKRFIYALAMLCPAVLAGAAYGRVPLLRRVLSAFHFVLRQIMRCPCCRSFLLRSALMN